MNKEEKEIQTIEKIFNIFGTSYLQEQADQISNLINQNFIGKEVIKKIELMRYTEEIKEMRGTEYANGWSDAVDKLLELLK